MDGFGRMAKKSCSQWFPQLIIWTFPMKQRAWNMFWCNEAFWQPHCMENARNVIQKPPIAAAHVFSSFSPISVNKNLLSRRSLKQPSTSASSYQSTTASSILSSSSGRRWRNTFEIDVITPLTPWRRICCLLSSQFHWVYTRIVRFDSELKYSVRLGMAVIFDLCQSNWGLLPTLLPPAISAIYFCYATPLLS